MWRGEYFWRVTQGECRDNGRVTEVTTGACTGPDEGFLSLFFKVFSRLPL